MAAAQLNHATMVPDLNASSQHSVKAMLIQKHLSELEKYQINKNADETNSDIDVDSPNDSGCEATRQAVKRAHTPSDHGDSISSGTDESAPYCKLPRMIDVETIDATDQSEALRAPAPSASRNVFSIRNLIYTKDTSDSESAESEDSGNVNSSSVETRQTQTQTSIAGAPTQTCCTGSSRSWSRPCTRSSTQLSRTWSPRSPPTTTT